jgi:hypothetical protein
MDQVLDTALVSRGLTGEPITGPHAAVQRRLGRLRRLQRVQPGRVNQRQPGQVSASLPLELAWRDSTRRRSWALAELTRSTISRRVPAGVSARATCSTCARLSTVGIALRRHTRLPSPASTRTVWALVIGKVDPDQPSSSILLPPWPWCLLGGGFAGAALAHGHGPKGVVSDDGTHACAATGPDPPGSGHFLIRGIRGRPRAAIRRTRLSAPAPSSEGDPTPPPEPAGMRMQPWDLGTDQAPRSLTSGQQGT